MDRNKFYGRKIVTQRFLIDAIDPIEDIEDVDIAIIGPPAGGDGSDVEQLDDDNLDDAREMPQEIAGEVDVMYECEEYDEDIEVNKSSKRQRCSQTKWKHSHIIPQHDLTLDKHESAKQLLLKKCPDLAGASEWSVFCKVFVKQIHILIQKETFQVSK
ncbi:hypothetical protein Pmani_001015 [Petrolisthes manimaculis]|uniref:Uncharacterized protein n=1 Tax=Petrolisthes manimaculis TaxID=1843537 RepID=A0AAE1QL88_9EUCA|nr:hypothetical protein Pmani_001015 [Petrolisthes manimaculis]